MAARIVLILALAAGVLFIVLVRMGGSQERPPAPLDLDAMFKSQLVSFNASTPTPDEAKALESAQAHFKVSREAAVHEVASRSHTRKQLEVVAHLLSGLVLLAAFLISLLAASKGVQLTATPTPKDLKALGKQQSRLRRAVLSLSAASALCAGAADRVSAYSARVGSEGTDTVTLIDKADDEFNRALGTKDVEAAANKLELRLAAM